MGEYGDGKDFKEDVFLVPLPEKLDPEVVRRTVEIARQMMSKGRKEQLAEEIRQMEEKLRTLKEQYQKEFGCEDVREE